MDYRPNEKGEVTFAGVTHDGSHSGCWVCTEMANPMATDVEDLRFYRAYCEDEAADLRTSAERAVDADLRAAS